jgi:hypothetical protein
MALKASQRLAVEGGEEGEGKGGNSACADNSSTLVRTVLPDNGAGTSGGLTSNASDQQQLLSPSLAQAAVEEHARAHATHAPDRLEDAGDDDATSSTSSTITSTTAAKEKAVAVATAAGAAAAEFAGWVRDQFNSQRCQSLRSMLSMG